MTIVFVTREDADFETLFFRYCSVTGETIKVMPAIGENLYGKPFFINCNIHFSISHSKGLQLTAFSKKPIGVDLEKIRPDVRFKKLSERFFKREERVQSAEEFFLLFTRKEAFIKQKGGALFKEIGAIPPENSQNYDVIAGFAVAVCTDDDEVVFIV